MYFDIGGEQVLLLSSQINVKKPFIRYNEPEILQPLYTWKDDEGDIKIDILPKVRTDGITEEHIYSLISSLAKKGFLLADCANTNIGLITNKEGQEVPVVIGDGCVIPLNKDCDNKELMERYYSNNSAKHNMQEFF